jgi:formate dehydrogenase subunit gamma
MIRYVKRFEVKDRVNHWTITILFFAAAFSGLALFHPSLYFLSNLFGGGPWTRILHPFIGVLVFAAFATFYRRHWRQNVLNEADREWRERSRDLLFHGDKTKMPPADMFNAGQKVMFWIMVGCIAAMLLTGVVFWRPWFAGFFPIFLVRAATLLHAVAATVFIIVVIGHVYVAIWTQGTVRGMVRGSVSEGWARQNHLLWYRKVTGRK